MIEKIKGITRGQAILVGFLLVCALAVFIGIKIAKSNTLKQFKKFQEELVVVAQNYKEINHITVKKDGEKRVSLKKLDNEHLVTNPVKDKCTGYVIISNEEQYPDEYEYIYRAYIKCGNRYTTPSYVEY